MDSKEIIIRPSDNKFKIDIKELWAYRDLL